MLKAARLLSLQYIYIELNFLMNLDCSLEVRKLSHIVMFSVTLSEI